MTESTSVDHAEQLKRKQCFVIAPIGKEDSDTRKRSDMLLEHVFTPALAPLGYEVVRADKISEPGSITIQVLDRIFEADLVIADLTDHNPNVFYELAVRHALNKGVIHVICTGQNIPFDIADLRTIHVVLDIPGAARAINDIAAQAKQLESGEVGKTPISLANILSRSGSAKSDEGMLIREMLDRLSELGTGLRELTQTQRATMHHLERRVEILARGLHRRIDQEPEPPPPPTEFRLSAKNLEEMLPTKFRDRFNALSKEGKDKTVNLLEAAVVLYPRRPFAELIDESLGKAEQT